MKSMIHLSLVLCICLSIISCSRPTNTPGPMSTESSSTVSSLSSTDTSSEDITHYENVEITTTYSPRVLSEKSDNSKYIERVDKGQVYKILRQEADGRGNLWYQIEIYVNATGWVHATDCRKTDKPITNPDRSTSGKLLNPAIDKDLLLKLLDISDNKAERFLNILGNGFSKTVNEYEASDENDAYTEIIYKYPNGIMFQCDGESIVDFFMIGENYYYLGDNQRFTGDITSDPGDEIFYYNDVGDYDELLVVRSDSATVIGNYRFAPSDNVRFLIGDFCGNGSNQIFYGQEISRYYNKFMYPDQSILFTIDSDGGLTTVLDYQALSRRLQDVRASIYDKMLSLDIVVDEYDFSQTFRLPDRIFLNSKNFPDKNAQLRNIIEWTVEPVDTKWYIIVDCIIAFDMYDAYWGLPGTNTDYGFLVNDLARTRLVYEIVGGNLEFRDGDTVIKYPDTSMSSNEPLVSADLGLQNGPMVSQTMDKAFGLLPDAPVLENYYAFEKTIDGVTLVADKYNIEIPEITDIIVEGPKYQSMRGIRVGDAIEKVERLYGKPDQGLPGDESAQYFLTFEYEGNVLSTQYCGIYFEYKDGKVASFQLFLHYMD
ncbi:MAG: SH3 domain-containing protein [Saccharofermentanales bacterium]